MWLKRKGIPPAGIDPPFTVLNRRANAKASGSFVPAAEVAFDKGLAASGLLSDISASEMQTLLAVLTQVTTEGRVRPTVGTVGRALRVPAPVALVRLMRLSRRRWRGRPFLYRIDGGGGIWAYAISPELLGQRLGPLETEPNVSHIAPAAGRGAVIASSRKRHSRPRAEAEALIARLNGWPLAEEEAALAAARRSMGEALEGDDLHAKERLIKLGVEARAAESLVRRFGRERVARQISYLPFRKAKEPAKLLVSAIEGEWEKPTQFPAGTDEQP